MINRKISTISATMILFTLLAARSISHAQAWQWGLRGGGSSDGANSSLHEAVSGIATDRNGNVYITGTIEANGSPTLSGLSAYLPVYGGKDILVASFTCNGVYRWSKVIGGVSSDFAGAIGTDSVGHVYVVGRCTPSTISGREIRFDSDSTQPTNVLKTMFMVQYDTSGRFQWLRQPTPDTTSQYNTALYSQTFDIQVDGNGDIYWLVQLPGGLVSGGGGWVAATNNAYVLKYNSQGVMTDHILPQMNTTKTNVQNFRFARSRAGMLVVSGNIDFTLPTITVGGASINSSMFLAAFDSKGNYRWKKENTIKTSATRMFSKPVIDGSGNIYFSGSAARDDVFNGYKFVNKLFGGILGMTSRPFISKVDSNGVHSWTQQASGVNADVANSLALKSQHEIWMSGSANSMWWDSTRFVQGVPNSGYPIYVARFNTAGDILDLDSLRGAGGLNLSTCNAVDRNGNLILGGEFAINLNIKPGTTLLNSGGYSDLFVAKYGFPCNCTTQPTSSFSSAITTGRTVRFTYGGSTANVDSLVWTWGDGQRQTVKSGLTTPLNYTYTTPGTYTACANVYGSCGTASFCKTTTVGNAAKVAELSLADNIKVYPNPTDRYLKIDGAEGATIALINTLGQPVLQQRLDSQNALVDIGSLPAGIYLLQVRDAAGNTGVVRVSKL